MYTIALHCIPVLCYVLYCIVLYCITPYLNHLLTLVIIIVVETLPTYTF